MKQTRGDGVRPEPPVDPTADDSCRACAPQGFFCFRMEHRGWRIMENALHLPPCEYRRVLASSGPGADPYVVCVCSGGLPIGAVKRGRGDAAGACGRCSIPAELDPARRPCLYLVPVRIWEDDSLRTGFSCRWFASLNPRYLPAEVWRCCSGCPHWFPRPPKEESVPGIDRWIRKVIRMYWERSSDPVGPQPPKGEPCPPYLLGDRIAARIRKLRVALTGRA